MDSEQTTEIPVRKTLWLKLFIAVLAIASIGQISVIFSSACIGQSPAPSSGLGFLLWPGILFMCIWSLRGKSKLKGFIIGAFIGFALYFSASVTAGYLSAEERAIDKVVASINKDLPKMIDEETILDEVSIDQKAKQYYFYMTLVNLSLSEIDINFLDETFEQSIKPSTCKDGAFNVFFSENYTINYVYKDNSGEIVRKYSVTPTDCK